MDDLADVTAHILGLTVCVFDRNGSLAYILDPADRISRLFPISILETDHTPLKSYNQ